MPFTLQELPYALDAQAPYISAMTLKFHHGKHHNTYVTNLNNLVKNPEYDNEALVEVIQDSKKNGKAPIFNNAAQHYNHSFFWTSMCANGGGEPKGIMAQAIERDFGSYNDFTKAFRDTAITHFGSGWAWLILDKTTKKLKVMGTHDADTPVAYDQIPILTLDVWEHAYYVRIYINTIYIQ